MSKRRILIFLFFLIITGIAGISIFFYKSLFADNIINGESGSRTLYISTGSDFKHVIEQLQTEKFLHNPVQFELLAQKMNYPGHIYPGRYVIPNRYSNVELIRKLRSGNQDPVKLVLNNIESKRDLASKVSEKLECDENELLGLLNDEDYLKEKGLTPDNALTLIISNTYEFYWNTDAKAFLKKMVKENERFWNKRRRDKAKSLGLSPTEAVILASIVQKESNKKDEYNDIAGVYINRLKQNWPLQADPTVKFAVGQPALKRVLNVHTQYDSPYNTYKYTGLPPGPICLPEIFAIDGVLNASDHGYMYFCAKDDFSGYHAFARTLDEHNLNARRYQQALNQRQIY